MLLQQVVHKEAERYQTQARVNCVCTCTCSKSGASTQKGNARLKSRIKPVKINKCGKSTVSISLADG